LKSALLAMFYMGAALWALFFFTPEFANTRWPWALNPFDARIMSAWFAGAAVWSITMYFMKDWAEVKMGIRAILLFLVGLLGVWLFGLSRFPLNQTEIAARQALSSGIVLGVLLAWLLFAYWKQEQLAKKVGTMISEHP
jgi:membrane protein DedA with SNARE-associated domain